MAKVNLHADRAARLVARLQQERDSGGEYPLTLARLRELVDPAASDDDLHKAMGQKVIAGQVVLAAKKDVASPVALADDATRLGQSPLLIEYAVGLLSTAEAPLHPLTKIAGKINKTLKVAFVDATTKGLVPESVVVHAVKGKPHLRLAKYTLPPPPEQALVEELLKLLRQARERGDYPLPLAELLLRAGHQAGTKVVKAALALKAYTSAVVQAVPRLATSLVVLEGDEGRLVYDTRLVELLLGMVRTSDNQAVPVAELGKKLEAGLRGAFASVVGDQVTAGTLGPSVGCLRIKKKPHLFLRADLLPPPEILKIYKPEEPHPIDFARAFEEAFRALDTAGHNQVSLVRLRAALPVERDVFDRELGGLRRSGTYFLQGAEGRHGLSEEERSAGIEEHGQLLLYVCRRE